MTTTLPITVLHSMLNVSSFKLDTKNRHFEFWNFLIDLQQQNRNICYFDFTMTYWMLWQDPRSPNLDSTSALVKWARLWSRFSSAFFVTNGLTDCSKKCPTSPRYASGPNLPSRTLQLLPFPPHSPHIALSTRRRLPARRTLPTRWPLCGRRTGTLSMASPLANTHFTTHLTSS